MPAREQPIQSYYPSARVRLIVRFEDYGDANTPKPPDVLPQLRRGQKQQSSKGSNLEVVNREGVLLLVGSGDDPSSLGSPQQQRNSEDQFTHVVDGIIPISAAWSQNGIRTADTLNIELEFSDFPIDPRVIRSCAVQYFLGTVSAEDFQRGIDGERRTDKVPANAHVPFNVIPDEYIDSNGNPRTNLRFEGWVDTWEAEWPEGDSPKVLLECTDNTRILIEQNHPSRLAVSVDDPLDTAVANYLSNFPQFRGISIEYQPRGQEVPTLKEALTKQAYPPGVGPSTSKGGDNKLSVWDYLTDVIRASGHNIRFEGTRVIIQRPRSLYNRKFPPRADDPFQSRTLPRLGTITRRLMIYGANIVEMRWARTFTKYAPLNVEVRSYNPRRKKTLIARFPQVDKRTKRLQPGQGSDNKFEVVSIPGIQDEAVLRSIAQQLYEVLGRNELGVTVLTKNLASFGGDNLDPDLLDAKVGDAVDVVIQRENVDETNENTVNVAYDQIARRPQEFLEELGFPSSFAAAYAAAANNISFPTTFRMKEIHIDWDKNSEGVRLDFDAVNYIEVRADADLPEGEEQEPETNAPEPSRVIVEDEVSN